MKAYLYFAGKPEKEYEEGRYFVHRKTFQDNDAKPNFCLTVDIESDATRPANLDKLPHEGVKVRKERDGTM